MTYYMIKIIKKMDYKKISIQTYNFLKKNNYTLNFINLVI